MDHRFVVNYKQPSEYTSVSELRQRRRNLHELAEALARREDEVVAERRQIVLSSELLARAKRLHDRECMKRHVDNPTDIYYECGLGAQKTWDSLPQHGDPADTDVDRQWTWVMEAIANAQDEEPFPERQGATG